MRIVIGGAGSVGTHLVKMFTESNYDVVVIDNDKEQLQEISSHFDVMTIFGSISSHRILKEAEIGKAKLFIAVSNAQETNILASIIAKKLGAKQTIARIDDSEYLIEQNKKMLTDLGLDSLVYPEILACEEIVSQLKQPGMIKDIHFTSGKLDLFAIRISYSSELAYKNLMEIDKLYPSIIARIVAIKREETTIIPRGKDVVLPEDILYIITDLNGKEEILSIMGIEILDIKNVMILGGSKIGVKVAKALEKSCFVKLFEKSREKSYEVADILKDTLVIHSEARTADFLLDEGISKTDAFIAVTGNSEINMLSCMLAKRLGVKKTIAEIENTDYIDLAKRSEIDYIINKKLIAASNIFTHVMDAEVLSVKYFAETKAQVFEFIVSENSKVAKKPLKDLGFPEQAIIGGVVRDEKPFIAIGDTQLKINDKVVVFSLSGISNELVKWFK